MSLTDGFRALFTGTNTTKEGKGEELREGVVGEFIPELALDKPDDELIALKNQWIKSYDGYNRKIKKIQDDNEKYWTGKHFSDVEHSTIRPLVDNRIWTAVESFLPIATRQNPEPLVSGGDSEEGRHLAHKVSKTLAYQADIQKLRLKVKKSTRFWLLYLMGCVKVGWDMEKNDIRTIALRPQKLILDPKATIDEDGYSGYYIGEYRQDKASVLKKRFPKHKDKIDKAVDGKLGTEISYIEWWTDEYVFWTLGDTVLDKMRNPHWNYEEDSEPTYDEFGDEIESEPTQLKNHFKRPKKPYVFLGVFNLGMQPHDDTNLIQQNLPIQDVINKRLRQIEKNVDNMNGGSVVSGDHFTKEQAADVAEALRDGSTVWVPQGSVNDAYKRETGTPLPRDVYQNLNDLRGQIDNVFGIHDTTRGERAHPETLGGRILLKGSDENRISFVSDYIEQFVDDVYNWWTQMFHVYYTEEHVGKVKAAGDVVEFVSLTRDDFSIMQVEEDSGEEKPIELLVSVREGSLIPKDPLIQRNEAVELFGMGALDPITLFDRLDFPNPKESAKNLFLWQNAPDQLFPELAQQAQEAQLAQQADFGSAFPAPGFEQQPTTETVLNPASLPPELGVV